MPRPPRSRAPRSKAAVRAEAPLPLELKRQGYRYLRANRLVEERLTSLYRLGKITGGLYRSLGQEATSVGSALALADGDILAPMIRNLGSLLVRGVRARDLFAQYTARAESPTQGKDNVVHFGTVDGEGRFRPDARGGIVSCISPLGNLVGVLAGMALAARLRNLPTVCLTYVGDGSSSTGEFHEGMNFACARKLPVVVVLENNGWAYSTPVSRQSRLGSFAERALLYGCPGPSVDGQDLEAVYRVTSEAVARAREGAGPTLIEARTYRMLGHAQHDDQRYVPPEELAAWAERDPLLLYRKRLLAEGKLSGADLDAIDAEVSREVDEELAAAEAMSPADTSVALQGVYNDPAMRAWTLRTRYNAGDAG